VGPSRPSGAPTRRSEIRLPHASAALAFAQPARAPRLAFETTDHTAFEGDWAYRVEPSVGSAPLARAAGKARAILSELFGGEIRLQPQPVGRLLALWDLHPAALLRAAGTCGSGGALMRCPARPAAGAA
jgi:hypothetical protein